MTRTPRRILGLDPSLRGTGLAVVAASGGAFSAICSETVRNPAAWPHSRCLQRIREVAEACIDRERPDAAAIESPFLGRNARTTITLGEVRGVLLAVCAAREVPVYEYAPGAVKRAVTGRGEAPKEQVRRMIQALTGFRGEAGEDEYDAMAVAICHGHRSARGGLDPAPEL